jgi:hypothetical protein
MTAICSWCKGEFSIKTYPNVADFYLAYKEGTTSDIFGPSLVGYEVENLCHPCALMLKDKLVDLGIKVIEIDV